MGNLAVYALTEGTASASLISEAMKTAYNTALSGVQSDVVDMVATALPYGLGIMGLFLGIRLGISFFRSIAH